MAGRAVVQHDGRADQQPADQEVPHHPAGGGEPQEPVARAQIPLQATAISGAPAGFRRPTGRSVSAARWFPRSTGSTAARRTAPGRTPGARRLGRQVVPARACRRASRCRGPGCAPRRARSAARPAAACDGVGGAELLAAVAISVDREQHRGRDLTEPVENRVRAEVRRARRPHRARCRGGQEADQRVRRAFGTSATTRSPGPTPSRRRPAWAAPTCSRSSASVSDTSEPSSATATTATCRPSFRREARRACSA